jgi:hypothetical protein
VLRNQAETASGPAGMEADVALETGDGLGYTIRIQSGTVLVGKGLPEDPTVRVITDPDTMAAVIAGSRSGVQEATLLGARRVLEFETGSMRARRTRGSGSRSGGRSRAGSGKRG